MSPLSVRLSREQRAQLERDAVGMSLNAYVLSRLFDKRPRKPPQKQQQAMARALRRLGNSGIAIVLMSRLVDHDEGRLELSEEEASALRKAFTDFHTIRRDLIEAMGLEADYGS